MHQSLFKHLSIKGYLVLFQYSAIMKKVAMNIHVLVYVWT